MKTVLPLLICIISSVLSVTPISAQIATSSATSSASTSTVSASLTSTSSSTTKGGVSMPEELPQTGSGSTTIALIIIGALTIGVGLYTRYALPLVLDDES